MPQLSFSSDEIALMVNELKKELVEAVKEDLSNNRELPPLLNKKQFMELVGISNTKCAELFNRADFPVTREFGNPRVPTKMLFEWIYKNTQNAELINFPFRATS